MSSSDCLASMHPMPADSPYSCAAAVYEYRPVIADPLCPCCGGAARTAMYGGEHRPILAERFKTKMCRNYERTGVCPYVHRCMFAHGDYELRTPDMNMADGLVTEEAIKEFKRINYEARCMAEYAACVASFELMSMPSCTPPVTPTVTPSHGSSRSSARADTPTPMLTSTPTGARRYRHDPYAQRSMWQPLLGCSNASIASA